jgi:hypothetical protein
MFSGIKTHERILSHNLTNAVAEELSRIPASLVDMGAIAIRQKLGYTQASRTTGNASLVSMIRAGAEAAKQAAKDVPELLAKGHVENDIFARSEDVKNALEEVGLDRELVTKSPLLNAVINGPMRLIEAEHCLSKLYGMARSIEAEAPYMAKAEAAAINQSIDKHGWADTPDGRITSKVGTPWIKERTATLRKTPTEPMIAQATGDAATMAFSNPNYIATRFNEVKTGLNDDTWGGAAGYTVLDMLFPVVKVMTNIFLKTREYHYGIPYSLGRAGIEIARTPKLQAAVDEANARLASAKDLEDRYKRLPPEQRSGKNVFGEGEGKGMPEATAAREEAQKQAEKAVKALADKGFTEEAQKRFAQTFGRGSIGVAAIALGAGLWGAGLMSGRVTGYDLTPQEAQDRKKTGIPAHSIRIGDTWLDVRALGPLFLCVLTGATLREHAAAMGDAEGALSTGAASLLHSMADAPFVRGVGNYEDLTSGSPGKFQRAAGEIATSYVPFGGALRTAAEATDSKSRKPGNFAEQIKAGVPILRQEVPISDRPKSSAIDAFDSVKGVKPIQISSRKGCFGTGWRACM